MIVTLKACAPAVVCPKVALTLAVMALFHTSCHHVYPTTAPQYLCLYLTVVQLVLTSK